MFKKPFRIKSNTQLKASDRRIIKEKILRRYPNLSETDFDSLVSKRDPLFHLKIVTASQENVNVYTVGKRPIVFEVKETCFPTLYFLWKFPNLIHTFITHKQVLNYLYSGADLMLPGVLTPPATSGLPKFGNLQEGEIGSVGLANNRAAVAVGITAQSSSSMLQSNCKGKCLVIYHILGDKLCMLDGEARLLPELGPPNWLALNINDFPALGVVPKVDFNINTEGGRQVPNDGNNGSELANSIEKVSDTFVCNNEIKTQAMDDLLKFCFLTAIKYSKTLTLPILTSNFYKLQLLRACPPDKHLDLKKTSYKRLKPFLDKMCQAGVITINEVKKGVESIVSINKDCQEYAEFFLEKDNRPFSDIGQQQIAMSTSIAESYIVTTTVLPLFSESGLSKDDAVTKADVRKYVTEYIIKNRCQDSDNPKLIIPKNHLEHICKSAKVLTWEEVFEKVCDSMKNCFQVSTGKEVILNKGKISPITLTVANRSGNKKVTLVDNVESFGINISELSKECQLGVAASTSISKLSDKKGNQLMIQGNQIIFVYRLLTEKYRVPKHYVKGMENAPKKKK